MNLIELEDKLNRLTTDLQQQTFIFDLLTVYNFPKSTISILKKNQSKLSGKENEVILKNKLLFHITTLEEDEHIAIDNLQKDKNTYKYNPRFIIVTDFVTFLAIDTKTKETLDISIGDLGKHYAFFLPWVGMEKAQHISENPADIRAAYKMDKLYQAIVFDNPEYYNDHSHDLNVFLSRLLFCFFAEDTGIFAVEGLFTNSIISHTQENGEGLDGYFGSLFDVLNAKENERTEFAHHFIAFPYVNGGLFEKKIKLPIFTESSRKLIVECGKLGWDSINPDIFGSMIQAVVHPGQRENLGMHYTSVPNIMKVIEPLFLNNLYEELEKISDDPKKLTKFRDRISKIKIFDPACGSGNFLIISYKELCKLEIETLKALNLQDSFASLEGWNNSQSGIKLDNFFGIEIDDFAHEIARLSLYLAQHQVNQQFEKEFGKLKPILPLKESGKIVCGNSTRIDWEQVCPRKDQSGNGNEIYVVGNPPYLGSSMQDREQKDDLALLCKGYQNYKNLDYISCWFIKGSGYIKNTNAKLAFVSTNSICQGEQVALLWPHILGNELEIAFAHTSFKWTNNAKGNAGVIVVIIGVRNISKEPKILFTKQNFISVANINAYLTSGKDLYIPRTGKPISNFPPMLRGTTFTDNGHLLLNDEEKNLLLELNPEASIFVKKLVGSAEFIRGISRWCLYITKNDLAVAENIPDIKRRLDLVSVFRKKSVAKCTAEFANNPWKPKQDQYKNEPAIIAPRVSSERREYIPCGFLNAGTVILDSAQAIYRPDPWIFSVINSKMHMIWVRAVGGRLKTDLRYSSALCYNTFPFPNITEKEKESLTTHVYNILEERERDPEKTMADLYDPDRMPVGLREAHRYLDIAIDQIYRSKPFESDEERLAHLFKLYEEMIVKETNG